MPIGFDEDGMPIDVQVVGHRWKDSKLLVIAGQLFDIAGNYKTPPGFTSE